MVPVNVVQGKDEEDHFNNSFFTQFATELTNVNEGTCNGDCTYDSDNKGSLTDHEST